ncbi:MAG TPA: type II secretion system protein [Tepidisphaeraceae bacterium]|jgi:prepilin-type N-terminal cleavage/methylation domain-containing protein/prepilin-type processing-associated H-X9-DG protein
MNRSADASSATTLRDRTRTAFTLVELLVVIGIIAVLIAILLPSLAGARRQSRTVQCASNMRQMCIAIFGYAAENKGKFPTNLSSPSPGLNWYDVERAGGYVSKEGPTIGSVFTCPDDRPGAKRSYSMNVWMSSKVDSFIDATTPPRGKLWGGAPRDGSRVILMVESWSLYDPDLKGREAAPVVGYLGTTAGQRFGGAGGISPPVEIGVFGKSTSELSFDRHRPSRSAGSGTDAIGALNIGYADGHVALKTEKELVDPTTGKSTLDSIWSPLDAENP